MRSGYLVLGMHRSGTSAVSGTLAKLGAAAPKTLLFGNSDNVRGHWESVVLLKFHDELLASAGSKWDDWRPLNPDWYETPVAAAFRERGGELLRAEFDGAPSFVLKDPRVCRFARFWFEVFAQEGIAPRPVMPVRQPLEVAQSLKTRDGSSLSKGLLLWLRHALDAEAATRNMPRAVFEWDSLLKDWRGTLVEASKRLGTPWPRMSDYAAEEVDAFLTRALRHEVVPLEAANLHPEMHGWIAGTYKALQDIARGEPVDEPCRVLDEIKTQFDDATTLFGRALGSLETKIDALTGALRGESLARMQEAERHTEEINAQKAVAGDAQRAVENALQAEQAKLNELQRIHAEELAMERVKVDALKRQHVEELNVERAKVEEVHQSHGENGMSNGAGNGLQRVYAEDLRSERARADEIERTHSETAKAERARAEAALAQLVEERVSRARAEERLNALSDVLAGTRDQLNDLRDRQAKELDSERSRADDLRRAHDQMLELAQSRLNEMQRFHLEELKSERSRADDLRRTHDQMLELAQSRMNEVHRSHLEELTAERGRADEALRNHLNDRLEWVRADERHRSLAEELKFERARAVEAQLARAAAEAERIDAIQRAHAEALDVVRQQAAESLNLERSRVEEIRLARDQLEARFVAAEQERVGLLDLREQLEQALADATEAAQSADQRWKVTFSEAQDLLARAQLAEQQLLTMTDAKHTAEAECAEAKQVALDLDGRYRQSVEAGRALERQYAEATQVNANLTQDAQRISAKNAELSTRIERFDADMQATQQANELRNHEIATLRRRVQALQGENDRLAAVEVSQNEALRGGVDSLVKLRRLSASEIDKAIAFIVENASSTTVPKSWRLARQAEALKRAGLFDPKWYCERYKDIADAGIDPGLHYVEHGIGERRDPTRVIADIRARPH